MNDLEVFLRSVERDLKLYDALDRAEFADQDGRLVASLPADKIYDLDLDLIAKWDGRKGTWEEIRRPASLSADKTYDVDIGKTLNGIQAVFPRFDGELCALTDLINSYSHGLGKGRSKELYSKREAEAMTSLANQFRRTLALEKRLREAERLLKGLLTKYRTQAQSPKTDDSKDRVIAVQNKMILKYRNDKKYSKRPSRQTLYDIADQCRKKNGKINYSKVAKIIGKTDKVAKKWLEGIV